MSLVAALTAGGALGVRHALETDHLAAVATLVEGEGDRSPGVVGASWGLGHSAPIVVLGLAFLALGVTLPEPVTLAIEGLVGVVLVALGARMVLGVLGGVALSAHAHDGHGLHRHLRLGRVSLGRTHVTIDGDSAVVGVLHGFAGSGALVVALVAASPSVGAALGFLVAFSALSVVTMAAVSVAWGRTLDTGLHRPLRTVAGLVGIAVGLVLLAEVVGVQGVAVPRLPFLH